MELCLHPSEIKHFLTNIYKQLQIFLGNKYNKNHYFIFQSKNHHTFCIVLSNISSEQDITLLIRNLHHYLEKDISENIGLQLNIKMGYTFANNLHSHLHLESNFALYNAMIHPFKKIESYQTQYQKLLENKIYFSKEIRNALSQNEFFLVFQPKFNSKDNSIIGGEVLIRWNHKGTVIPPNNFIPIAEEHKIVYKLDLWVLKKTFNTFISHNELRLPLSINFAPEDLENEDFINQALVILENNKQLGHLLEIEITERTLMIDKELIKERLNLMTKYNVSISLDDFGISYSSLSILPEIPLHSIKIDRSFINQLEHNMQIRKLVKNIIQLCNDFNYDVIAEGVETKAQKEILLELGCVKMQGYLFSKPISFRRISFLCGINFF
ncbi:MAG: hypothetical protein KatS3mg129_1705 [Leptospiraceae bacterium]|nr:MAG: hypothetical protein KatS3mg129_1705 [Leptospiraceae bacterium]